MPTHITGPQSKEVLRSKRAMTMEHEANTPSYHSRPMGGQRGKQGSCSHTPTESPFRSRSSPTRANYEEDFDIGAAALRANTNVTPLSSPKLHRKSPTRPQSVPQKGARNSASGKIPRISPYEAKLELVSPENRDLDERLREAVRHGDLMLTMKLLEVGGNPASPDRVGYSAVEIARAKGDQLLMGIMHGYSLAHQKSSENAGPVEEVRRKRKSPLRLLEHRQQHQEVQSSDYFAQDDSSSKASPDESPKLHPSSENHVFQTMGRFDLASSLESSLQEAERISARSPAYWGSRPPSRPNSGAHKESHRRVREETGSRDHSPRMQAEVGTAFSTSRPTSSSRREPRVLVAPRREDDSDGVQSDNSPDSPRVAAREVPLPVAVEEAKVRPRSAERENDEQLEEGQARERRRDGDGQAPAKSPRGSLTKPHPFKLSFRQQSFVQGAANSPDDSPVGSTSTITTFLRAACKGNNSVLINLIRSKKVNVDSTDGSGDTALIHAARNGRSSSCRILLESGASLLHRNNNGVSALHEACMQARSSIILLLLRFLRKAGVDVGTLTTNDGWTPLHFAVSSGCDKALIDAIVESGFDPNVKTKENLTLKTIAIEYGWDDLANYLMSDDFRDLTARYFNVSAQAEVGDPSGILKYTVPPQWKAFLSSTPEAARSSLKEWEAPVRNAVVDGQRLIHHIAKTGHHELFDVVLEGGFSMKEKDKSGNNILHHAVLSQSVDTVEDVLTRDASLVCEKNAKGQTPEELAFSLGLDSIRDRIHSERKQDEELAANLVPTSAAPTEEPFWSTQSTEAAPAQPPPEDVNTVVDRQIDLTSAHIAKMALIEKVRHRAVWELTLCSASRLTMLNRCSSTSPRVLLLQAPSS